MMLEWKQGSSVHSVSAKTDLAAFRIFWDTRNSRVSDAIRYVAQVETISGDALCIRDDLPSMDEARAWCQTTYVTILQEEIARFI